MHLIYTRITRRGTATLHLDLPGADQSSGRRKEIDTNLGSGGPTVSFETVNGGVSVR